MKKLINILIALTLILSSVSFVPAFAEDEDVVVFNEYIYHLRNIGILEGDENGEIQEDAIMTRAQFCALITKLTGAYGTVAGLENNLFTDVANNYWGKDYIVYCAEMGLISGVGDNKFEPEAPILTNQAIKIIVELLGYGYMANINGGYPTGYLMEARTLGLTTGVDLNEEEISMKNIARLVFNSLDIDLARKTGVKGDQVNIEIRRGENILTEYLSMNIAEGVLDGCFSYVLAGSNSLEKDEITIDRVIYTYSGNALPFMGQNVIMFYYIDEESNSRPEVKSLLPTEKDNEVITVDVRDIVSSANNVITYEVSETKEQDLKLTSSIKYVYNYELLMTYDIKKLPDIKNGKIEVIDNNNDNSYDVIKIFDYETYVVENATDKYISGKFNDSSIDMTDTDKLVMISDVEGNKIAVTKIKENSVLFVIETDNTIDITVSLDIITGVIESLGDGELSSGGKAYEISGDYSVSNNYIGSMADLYLDPFGRVAFIVESLSTDLLTGYFISVKEPPTEHMDGYIKVLETNGLVNSYKLNTKVRIGGVPTDIYQKFADISDYLSDSEGAIMPQVIRFKLNDENLVTEIETAVKSVGNEGDAFVMPYGEYGVGKESEYYGGTFEGIIFPSTQTICFLVPSKATIETGKTDNDDYTVMAFSDIPSDRKFKVDAYYYSKDHQNADVIVMYDANSMMANIESSFDNTMNVYLEKTFSVNEDEETVQVLKYFDGKETKKAVIASEFTAFDSLVRGDIIRFSTNTKGEIASGEVVYRVTSGALTTKGSAYTASIRISGGYVASVRNNMFRVENEKGATEGSEFLSLVGYPTNTGTVIVVEKENGNVYVRSGSSIDIGIGDYVIVQQRTSKVKTIVVFK